MSAVLRLSLTWFAGTPLTRRLAAIGAVAMVAGTVSYANMPSYFVVFQSGDIPWYFYLVLPLPWAALIALVSSTALMPAMIERMALGRAIWILPFGRVSLLASALVPAAILAIATATAATTFFINSPFPFTAGDHIRTFSRTLLMAFVDFGLIYMAIWLVGKTSGVWRLCGMLGVVVSITIPLRYTGGFTPFSALEGIGLASWFVFAGIVLSGGRARHSQQRLRARLQVLATGVLPSVRYTAGRETDLLLGTTRPWVVAFGQTIPIAAMVWFVPYAPIWIVFLVTFSAVAGAVTSQAAPNSRRLWLRYGWTRDEIYRQAHRSFWRYNALSLGVLLLIYAGMASYSSYFNSRIAALSVALIIVGGIACTYLGLMITRGLGWFETALGVLTMTSLALAGIAIARSELVAAFELELLIACLGIVYALIARRRWTNLDWMQCRPETTARTAA